MGRTACTRVHFTLPFTGLQVATLMSTKQVVVAKSKVSTNYGDYDDYSHIAFCEYGCS